MFTSAFAGRFITQESHCAGAGRKAYARLINRAVRSRGNIKTPWQQQEEEEGRRGGGLGHHDDDDDDFAWQSSFPALPALVYTGDDDDDSGSLFGFSFVP